MPTPSLGGFRFLPLPIQRWRAPYATLGLVLFIGLSWASGGILAPIVEAISEAVYELFLCLI